MIPIAIPTRNRLEFLDVTLRSLTASDLPADVPVWLFDDKGYRAEYLRYMTTNDTFDLVRPFIWPKGKGEGVVPPDGRGIPDGVPPEEYGNYPRLQLEAPWWPEYVGDIPDLLTVTGISGKAYMRTGQAPYGVVTNSMHALGTLFYRYPDANTVLLMQDDVVVKQDFYQQLELATSYMNNNSDVGIVGAFTFYPHNKPPGIYDVAKWLTAQMYLVHRRVYDAATYRFSKYYKVRKNFDVLFCRFVKRKLGMNLRLIRPGLCQHIGIDSAVRPHLYDQTKRIDWDTKAPFALGDTIRDFKSGSVSTTRT